MLMFAGLYLLPSCFHCLNTTLIWCLWSLFCLLPFVICLFWNNIVISYCCYCSCSCCLLWMRIYTFVLLIVVCMFFKTLLLFICCHKPSSVREYVFGWLAGCLLFVLFFFWFVWTCVNDIGVVVSLPFCLLSVPSFDDAWR